VSPQPFTPQPSTPTASLPGVPTPTPFAPSASPGTPGLVKVPVTPDPRPEYETETIGNDEGVHKKWWFWTIIGVVVVGGAVTAGVLLAPAEQAPPTGFSTNVTWE
jgi:hypothetical protein